MKRLIPLCCSIALVIGSVSCARKAQSHGVEIPQAELIDASDLDPAEIAAYDREESEPFQGIPLKECALTVVTKSNDSLPLMNILDSDILYVRYSQYACGDCIKFLNSALEEYNSAVPSVKIRFLLKDIGMRDLHVLENQMGKRFEIFKIDSLPTDFDEAYTPYLFKLDKDLNVRHHYIPRKELPDSLHEYLYNNL